MAGTSKKKATTATRKAAALKAAELKAAMAKKRRALAKKVGEVWEALKQRTSAGRTPAPSRKRKAAVKTATRKRPRKTAKKRSKA